MRLHRFVGYDLNGRRDMAARSWLVQPGEEEQLEGTFVVSGGLNGAIVRVDEERKERLVGGALARLAPHGRGDGWGAVGARDRRTSTHDLVLEPGRHLDGLAVALNALGGGADVAVASLDDIPGVREAEQEAWLRAMRDVRNRRRLHVWRPVLAVLAAIEDGLLDAASSVAVISQRDRGLATQRLKIREAGIRAPERRKVGRLHECGLGFDRLLERAQELVGSQISARTREEGLAQLDMPIRMVLGLQPGPELYRSWNGSWTIVSEVQSASLVDGCLPSSIEKELSEVDAVLVETLAEGPVRDRLASMVALAAVTEPIVLATDAIAKGALIAARRLFNGDPVYFDFLPQISTIVQDGRGPKNFDLIPPEATLPAGKIYRSEAPATLGLQIGQSQITVYLNKELEERPRKAELSLPSAAQQIEEVRCLVEQAPAIGRARIFLESDLFQAPMTVDWDNAEELDEAWETVIEGLETPKPTIPNRLVLPATRELWDDQPQRTGLLTFLREAHAASEPNWKVLANKLNSREGDAYCVSSDGELPAQTSAEETELLDEIRHRALEHTLARGEGKIVEDDNDALRFLTWLFKRCDSALVPELLKALEAQRGHHPFIYHQGNRRLIYQGLGRILSDRDSIRKVFDHLMAIPATQWKSMNHVACAAFLLSRTDEAPQILERSVVDTLAKIGARTLKESIRRGQFNTLRYPPFLMVGLLRWRAVDNWALVAGIDPVADAMLEAVQYALPPLERWAREKPNLRRLYKALNDVRDELKGEGRNPDLLLELASL